MGNFSTLNYFTTRLSKDAPAVDVTKATDSSVAAVEPTTGPQLPTAADQLPDSFKKAVAASSGLPSAKDALNSLGNIPLTPTAPQVQPSLLSTIGTVTGTALQVASTAGERLNQAMQFATNVQSQLASSALMNAATRLKQGLGGTGFNIPQIDWSAGNQLFNQISQSPLAKVTQGNQNVMSSLGLNQDMLKYQRSVQSFLPNLPFNVNDLGALSNYSSSLANQSIQLGLPIPNDAIVARLNDRSAVNSYSRQTSRLAIESGDVRNAGEVAKNMPGQLGKIEPSIMQDAAKVYDDEGLLVVPDDPTDTLNMYRNLDSAFPKNPDLPGMVDCSNFTGSSPEMQKFLQESIVASPVIEERVLASASVFPATTVEDTLKRDMPSVYVPDPKLPTTYFVGE